MTYAVVYEIQVDAETPLEAAKQVQALMQDKKNDWQYYVKNEDTDETFSVDLQEEDEDAVLPVDKYEPLIK